MNLMQAIAERRAVRQFRATPIADDTVHHLIDAATLAPSARNLQPWSFAVLRDQNKIAGFADEALQWLLVPTTAAAHLSADTDR
jgi:nitroreductase